MPRESRAVWEKRVERFRASDLTAPEFAAEVGVNVNTLRSWLWRLEREPAASSAERAAKPGRPAKATFVEVSEGASTNRSEPLEVVVGERVVIRVSPEFDADTLRRVLDVLGAMP
jgi:predicted ArsR family transcriptional regulator